MIRSMKKQECKIYFKENCVAWERERDHVGAVREEVTTGSGLGVCETFAQPGAVQSYGIFWVIYRDFAAQKLHVPMSHIYL